MIDFDHSRFRWRRIIAGSPLSRPIVSMLASVFALGVRSPAMATECASAEQDPVQLLSDQKNRPIVIATINHKQVPLVVDTGAQGTTLTEELAESLQLPRDRAHVTSQTGIGGRRAQVQNVMLDEFGVGALSFRHLSVPVIVSNEGTTPEYQGVLGADFLFRRDVSFDFPSSTMAFYKTGSCAFDGTPDEPGYLPLNSKFSETTGRLMIPVVVDGHNLWGVLDTGASNVVMTEAAALLIGVAPEIFQRSSADSGRDAAGVSVGVHAVDFASVDIGPEHFNNIKIPVVTASFGEADFLIGMNFLKNQKIRIRSVTGKSDIMPAAPLQSQTNKPDALPDMAPQNSTTPEPVDRSEDK